MKSKARVRFLSPPALNGFKKRHSVEKKANEDIDTVHEYSKLDSFQNSVGPILALAQFFALMPVCGVMTANPKRLLFEWASFRVLYTISFILVTLLNLLFFLNRMLRIGLNVKNIISVVFFSYGIIVCLLFLNLAYKWPKVMKTWAKTEMIFLLPPYKTPKWTLRTRNRIAATVVLSLAFMEHVMYNISNTHKYIVTARLCNASNDLSWEVYFIRALPHIFENVAYNATVTIVFLFCNAAFTFIWNYADLFIIIISLSLTIRFEQINFRISELIKGNVNEDHWSDVRRDYVTLCELLEMVDDIISPITIISCGNNLYFVSSQLLNIFNKLRFRINYFYFWFSVSYLIGRTIAVFVCAATVNDESKKSLKELRSIPARQWFTEVERLVEQMTNQCVALSGMNFFYFTRKLLFGMAGTLATYEFVLLQLDKPNRVSGLGPLCD